jgi:diguanylate cyclase (GGDEF)-like protein
MRRASRGSSRIAAVLSTVIASAAAIPAFASPFFTELGTREGLPDSSVSGMAQDGQGFIWFGTPSGLARYDGISFKLFSHDPFDAGSLPRDRVRTIYMDGELLWAGTDGGLARLDLATERFVVYAEDVARPDSLSNDVVNCIARDARGRLWIATMSGLDLLDEATGRFTRYRHDPADPTSLPADEVRALATDREGRLWVGTSGGGLALFDYAAKRFRSYPNSLSDFVTALDLDPAGRLWVGTWKGGLSLFDPASGRFENHPTADGRVCSVFAGAAGSAGVVFAGTWGGGLFAYDLASGKFSRYRSAAAPGSLSSDLVSSIMRDSSGLLWIGTSGGGVCRMDGSDPGFELLSAGPETFPPGKVSALLMDRLGYLWVGVYGEGLARRDPATGAWRRYRRAPGDPRSLPDDIVNFIREDSGGEIWVGTDEGLARYDRGADSFSVVLPLPGGAGSPSSETVSAMVDDPAGGAWIGTIRSGLLHWDGGGAGARRPVVDHRGGGGGASLSDDIVEALGYDDRGRLWVGTNEGLDRLEGGALVHRLASDSIRTIFLDSRKLLWIGTAGGGLLRYEPETDSFVGYTKRDGLPSDTIQRILEDSSGDLWIAARTGLAVFDRAAGRFRALNVRGERPAEEFSCGAFRASDGSLYFGAVDRLYRFDPARYEFNGRRPPVVMCSIEVPGRPTIGAAAAARLGRLELSWREKSVVFDFAALDYRDPGRNRYSYRLEGLDAAWSPAGPGHTAAYARLPGGSYTFRVKASNDDGLWNEEGISLQVRVGLAPWASPWAILLYALLLAGGGWSLAFFPARSSLRASRAEADILVSKLIDASATMENAAILDPLTGLPNPRKAEQHLELAFERAVRDGLEIAVLAVDIDDFKAFNDRCGKSAGDECLRSIARALSGIVRRSSDFVARYGGEEFLFVLEETGMEGALAKGEEARRAVEALAIPSGFSRSGFSRSGANRPGGRRSAGSLEGSVVTISVGCASLQPETGQTALFLLAAAEKALMAAKQKGRNRSSA